MGYIEHWSILSDCDGGYELRAQVYNIYVAVEAGEERNKCPVWNR